LQVTSVPVSVSENDREFAPVGIKSEVSAGSDEQRKEAKLGVEDSSEGAVSVSSVAANADVLLGGTFAGNAPAALKLSPGETHYRRQVDRPFRRHSRDFGSSSLGGTADGHFGETRIRSDLMGVETRKSEE
jgi:hypothetical protein